MSVTVINNKEEKGNLIKLLESFNTIQGYFRLELSNVHFGIMEDRDGNSHYIAFMGEEISEEAYKTIDRFHNNYFGAGSMCLEKTKRINKVLGYFCKDKEIERSPMYSFTTLISFSVFFNPYIGDLLRMSEFEYIIQRHIEIIDRGIESAILIED